MADATERPRRMRYSFETRCRAVTAMLTGMSPGAAALAGGAARATGYRWWARYQADRWAGLQARPSTPHRQPRRLSPAAEAEILAARQRSGAGPVTLGALLGRPALDGGEGAAAVGALAPAPGPTAPRRAL